MTRLICGTLNTPAHTTSPERRRARSPGLQRERIAGAGVFKHELEGVLTWTVEGAATEIGPGDTLCIPRGAVHQFDNPHDADAKTLAIVTPGILGPDYFREVAEILDAAAGGPPDYAALGEVMNRHGLTCAE